MSNILKLNLIFFNAIVLTEWDVWDIDVLLLQRKDSEIFRSWCRSGEAELSPGVCDSWNERAGTFGAWWDVGDGEELQEGTGSPEGSTVPG